MTVLGRPICQILGGHDWERRGRPIVETVPVVGGYAVADSITAERLKRIYVHYVSVPPPQEPCPVSFGVAEDVDERSASTVTCTLTATAGSDITAGDLVTFTGEEIYFECGRCGFVGESQWDDERLPAPVWMRGTDALVWWFLRGYEPSGWRWVPESERIAEGRE